MICSESRPVCEGLATAKTLARAGVPITLVTDAALGDLVRQVEMFVTGADAITPKGLINKVGTCGLAIVAKEYQVPFYCLCAEDKFLVAPLFRQFQVVEKNPEEVSRLKIKNVQIRNYYFDVTPFKYVSRIVTNKEIFSDLSALARTLKTRKVCRLFLPVRKA